MIEAASALLPVAPFLPEIVSRLAAKGGLVLRAEPGAGKTSLVPLALAKGFPGKVIVLEPRRVAAIQAAARAEELLFGSSCERAKQEIGYRVRGDSKSGERVEFVTSGVFVRMIQSDPGLSGVSCVVFDEFHERSLDSDLALALALEARVLAPELRILLMVGR